MGSTVMLSEVLEKLPLPGWGDRKILGQLLLFYSSNSGVWPSLNIQRQRLWRKSYFMWILPEPSVWSCFGGFISQLSAAGDLILNGFVLGNREENVSLYILLFTMWSPLPPPLLLLLLLLLLLIHILLDPVTFCGQHLGNGFCQWWLHMMTFSYWCSKAEGKVCFLQ